MKGPKVLNRISWSLVTDMTGDLLLRLGAVVVLLHTGVLPPPTVAIPSRSLLVAFEWLIRQRRLFLAWPNRFPPGDSEVAQSARIITDALLGVAIRSLKFRALIRVTLTKGASRTC
jgi:hypothetical protein